MVTNLSSFQPLFRVKSKGLRNIKKITQNWFIDNQYSPQALKSFHKIKIKEEICNLETLLNNFYHLLDLPDKLQKYIEKLDQELQFILKIALSIFQKSNKKFNLIKFTSMITFLLKKMKNGSKQLCRPYLLPSFSSKHLAHLFSECPYHLYEKTMQFQKKEKELHSNFFKNYKKEYLRLIQQFLTNNNYDYNSILRNIPESSYQENIDHQELFNFQSKNYKTLIQSLQKHIKKSNLLFNIFCINPYLYLRFPNLLSNISILDLADKPHNKLSKEKNRFQLIIENLEKKKPSFERNYQKKKKFNSIKRKKKKRAKQNSHTHDNSPIKSNRYYNIQVTKNLDLLTKKIGIKTNKVEIKECDVCGSTELITDAQTGYLICSNCGIIVDESPNFGYQAVEQEKNRNDPSLWGLSQKYNRYKQNQFHSDSGTKNNELELVLKRRHYELLSDKEKQEYFAYVSKEFKQIYITADIPFGNMLSKGLKLIKKLKSNSSGIFKNKNVKFSAKIIFLLNYITEDKFPILSSELFNGAIPLNKIKDTLIAFNQVLKLEDFEKTWKHIIKFLFPSKNDKIQHLINWTNNESIFLHIPELFIEERLVLAEFKKSFNRYVKNFRPREKSNSVSSRTSDKKWGIIWNKIERKITPFTIESHIANIIRYFFENFNPINNETCLEHYKNNASLFGLVRISNFTFFKTMKKSFTIDNFEYFIACILELFNRIYDQSKNSQIPNSLQSFFKMSVNQILSLFNMENLSDCVNLNRIYSIKRTKKFNAVFNQFSIGILRYLQKSIIQDLFKNSKFYENKEYRKSFDKMILNIQKNKITIQIKYFSLLTDLFYKIESFPIMKTHFEEEMLQT
jgi:hypothetical protein